jgi:photosystem II stability/assembly factor-like uncharacterized protein
MPASKLSHSLTILTLLLSVLPLSAQRWIYPNPQGNDLKVVKIVPGTTDVLAAGANATLMRSKDGGKSWNIQYHIAGGAWVIEDMALVDSTHWYLIGNGAISAHNTPDSSVVLKTTDAGKNWTLTKLKTVDLFNSYNQIEFLNKDTGFVSALFDPVLRTLDGGKTWKYIDTVSSFYLGGLMHFSNEHTGILIKATNSYYYTGNAGSKWSVYISSGLYARAISFINPKIGYIVGPDVRRTLDSGRTWSVVAPEDTSLNQWITVKFLDSTTGYGIAYGKHSGMYFMKTTDAGFTWSKYYVSKGPIWSLAFSSPDTGYAVGALGITYRTTDAGKSWQIISSKYYGGCYSIDFYTRNGYAGLQTQGLMHTNDYGNHWTYDSAMHLPVIQVSATGEQTAYLLTREWAYPSSYTALWTKRLMRTTNGGRSWDTVFYQAQNAASLNRFSFPDDSTGYMVGDSGLVLKTLNRGKSWTKLNAGISMELTDVYFTDDSTGYVLAGRHTLRRTTDGGLTWTGYMIPITDTIGRQVKRIYFLNRKVGFALMDYDFVYKTTDGGQTWKAKSKTPNDNFDMKFMDGGKYGFITGIPMYLTTTDSGETWTENSYPYSGISYAVHPVSRKHVYLSANQDGMVDISSDTVTAPAAAFNYAITCTGKVYFINSSTYSLDTLGYRWDFGDGSKSTQKSPAHTYKATGTYKITLWVMTPDGVRATTTTTASITVVPLDFTVSLTKFSSSFTPSDTSFTSYKWYFGDGDSSTVVNPSHTYPRKDSTYTVKLVAQSKSGCIDTIVKTVSVKNGLAEKDLTTFRIYPNPATDMLTIEHQQGIEAAISIYDENGKEVYSSIWPEQLARKTIDISALHAGIYLVKINSARSQFIEKLMISK